MAEKTELFLKECYVQDIVKNEGLKKWNELEIGKDLSLKYEEGKVVVKKDANTIGTISNEDAEFIDDLLKMDWSEIFIARVSYKDEKILDSNKRLMVVIYINKKNKAEEVPAE